MPPMAKKALAALCVLTMLNPAYAEPALPVPKDTQLSIVGEDMSVNGASMHAYELRSALSARELLDFYAAQWPGETRVSRLAPWTILSHPDGDHLVTVQVQALPGGASFGYVGITNLLEPSLRLRRSDFPRPSGAELITDVQARDQGRRSRTVLLRSEGSLEQNLAWYESHYRRQGWQAIGDPRGKANLPGSRTLLMNKGSGELNLVIASEGSKSVVTVVLVQPD